MFNRKKERILGLIGALLAAALIGFTLYLCIQITLEPGKYDEIGIHFTSSDIQAMYMMYIPAFIASIISAFAALNTDKNPKICGIIMIVTAIIIIFSNIINIISFILLMCAGVMCLVRKEKKSFIQKVGKPTFFLYRKPYLLLYL